MQDLGCTEKEAKRCTDEFRPVIQDLLNSHELPVVISALSKAFFYCLREVGATDEQCDHWQNAVGQFEMAFSRSDINKAYTPLANSIGKLVAMEQVNPLAAAYSLIGAIGSIFDQLDKVSKKQKKELLSSFLSYLNQARAQ
ncbi:hypothetical protein AB833_21675 [Chromatiales bacterium (ex Bugula neritina AB1)]|nr:hypothetical protein AB833_21675 [Chromatiales bacterium (ex Bugula neritina AB1)]